MKKFGNPMGTVPKAQHKSIGQAHVQPRRRTPADARRQG